MKDILLYISDQHSWHQQGYAGDPIVRTPNLDRLAAEGTVMMNNYTAYPLCVPARMSLMSGQLCSNCGVMGNFAALDSNRATFAHSLNAAGYETVLCGRMHFVGPDQRHGFSKRLVGDITPIFVNRPTEAFRRERGVHMNTPTGGLASLTIVGGGDSPTLEFDNSVVNGALEYLNHDYDKPQFLCVGTYGPHHPYVAPKELYEYYYDKMELPEETWKLPDHPGMTPGYREYDPDVVRAVRAAYYGMVEFEDQKIGQVYDAFQAYLKRTGHEGVFVYVSDHGDMIGYRGMYGKTTFYESSVHTPMLFVGDGIEKGKVLNGATSLTDIGPTLCELAGARIPANCDFRSLAPQLSGAEDDLERMVISELGGEVPRGSKVVPYGQMVKYKNFKYIHFHGMDDVDLLYDIAKDPLETTNVIADYPEFIESMKAELSAHCAPYETIAKRAAAQAADRAILAGCSFDSPERWVCPEAGRGYPEIMVSTKQEIPAAMKAFLGEK